MTLAVQLIKEQPVQRSNQLTYQANWEQVICELVARSP